MKAILFLVIFLGLHIFCDVDAMDFLNHSRLGEKTLSDALRGRAFFEAYPNVEIPSPKCFPISLVREDTAFLQNFPMPLTAEEIVLIHRENACKERRFFEVFNLLMQRMPKVQRLLSYLSESAYYPLLYQKLSFHRARPFDVVAGMPLVLDKPSLPGYPSGDATEAYLMALVLADFFGNPVAEEILKIGKGIGKRRVLAGVSFPSDVAMGWQFAEQLKPIFLNYPHIQKLIPEVEFELRQCGLDANHFERIDFKGTKEGSLHFKETDFEAFLGKLQLLTKKKIICTLSKAYTVTEKFSVNAWPLYLDLIVGELGLRKEEDENTIIIWES